MLITLLVGISLPFNRGNWESQKKQKISGLFEPLRNSGLKGQGQMGSRGSHSSCFWTYLCNE